MSSIRSRIALLLTTLLMIAAPVVSYASLTPDNTGLKAAAPAGLLVNACNAGTNCLAVMAGRIIGVAFGFIGILLLGLFLYGGFLWMTAGGEKEKVTKAQGILANAVAGILIISVSYAVASYVLTQLDHAQTGYSDQLGY